MSKAEGARYRELKLLERGGAIRKIECQPRFPIVINGQKVCDYVADFKYYDVEQNREVIEDVKGMKTPIYNLKKKLVLAVLGLEIIEIS